MDPSRLAVLQRQLAMTWTLGELLLDGLSDADCFWEPVPGSWMVRLTADGTWRPDWEEPEPDPAPAAVTPFQGPAQREVRTLNADVSR
jgi:hypothetical protein